MRAGPKATLLARSPLLSTLPLGLAAPVWCRHEEANRFKRFTEVLDDGTTIEIVDGWPTAPVYVDEARVGALVVRRGLAWRFESAAKGFTAKGGPAAVTWKRACRDFVSSVQEGGRVARYVWLTRSRVETGRRTAGSLVVETRAREPPPPGT